MPVSKKKRKSGKTHGSRERTYFTMSTFNTEKIGTIVDAIQRAELAVEMKLHKGDCTYNDLGAVRDVMDSAQIALLNRKCFDQSVVDEYVPLFIKATEAIYAIAKRAQDRGLGSLIGTAEEIAAIRDSLIPSAQLVRESFEVCPRTMLHEWELMLKLHVKATDKPFVEMSRTQVRKEIQNMVGKAGYYIQKRYSNEG